MHFSQFCAYLRVLFVSIYEVFKALDQNLIKCSQKGNVSSLNWKKGYRTGSEFNNTLVMNHKLDKIGTIVHLLLLLIWRVLEPPSSILHNRCLHQTVRLLRHSKSGLIQADVFQCLFCFGFSKDFVPPSLECIEGQDTSLKHTESDCNLRAIPVSQQR